MQTGHANRPRGKRRYRNQRVTQRSILARHTQILITQFFLIKSKMDTDKKAYDNRYKHPAHAGHAKRNTLHQNGWSSLGLKNSVTWGIKNKPADERNHTSETRSSKPSWSSKVVANLERQRKYCHKRNSAGRRNGQQRGKATYPES